MTSALSPAQSPPDAICHQGIWLPGTLMPSPKDTECSYQHPTKAWEKLITLMQQCKAGSTQESDKSLSYAIPRGS